MNVCIFTGYFVEDPVIDFEDNVEVVEFTLAVENHKGKFKLPSYLRFEAWDSGAKLIGSMGKKDRFITVSATAKNYNPDLNYNQDIIFRVNEFEFPRM